MTNEDRVALRKRLAENVMGWRYDLRNKCWYTMNEKNFIVKESKWTPDLHTPDGLFQCLGPGGLVEKMRAQRPDGSDGFNFNLNWQAHKGIKIALAQFHRIDGKLEFGQGTSEILGEAIVVAADMAMEEKVQ